MANAATLGNGFQFGKSLPVCSGGISQTGSKISNRQRDPSRTGGRFSNWQQKPKPESAPEPESAPPTSA